MSTIDPNIQTNEEHTIYGLFARGGQHFGLAVEFVREVINGQSLTLVPRAPTSLAGVLSLRGEVLPVVLIDTWLGLSSQTYDERKPILVVRRHDLLIGFQVDAVESVANLSRDDLHTNPLSAKISYFRYLYFRDDHTLISLLNGEKLLQVILEQMNFNV